jgi:hypothetical protein
MAKSTTHIQQLGKKIISPFGYAIIVFLVSQIFTKKWWCSTIIFGGFGVYICKGYMPLSTYENIG